MRAITEFKGTWGFLSNFHRSSVHYGGITYPTAEHAYQAQKTGSMRIRHLIASMRTPGEAKAKGREVKVRDDWDKVKVRIMGSVLQLKFDQNVDLKQRLLITHPAQLIEGNWWHDNFWGDCYCHRCWKTHGENTLGKQLMELREWYMKTHSITDSED